MLRPAAILLMRLGATIAALAIRASSAAPRAWAKVPVPSGPPAPRPDRLAWGAIRARLGAAFGLVPA